MNNKIKGILTPIATIIVMIPAAIVTALILESTSNDGWAALAALAMLFMLTGIIVIIELIIGVFLFFKKKSEYGLGIMYGFVGILVAGVLFSIFVTIYNSII